MKGNPLVMIAAAFLLSACGNSPPVPPTPAATAAPSPTPSFTSTPPARTDCASRYPSDPVERRNFPGDEWTVSTLEEHCLERALVETGAAYLAKTYNYSSLVIVRHGELVYEQYFTRTSNPDRSVEIYSMTKSYLSALTGIAIDQGLLDSLDHKVFEYFPEYFTPDTDPRMYEVSLRDLLTMTVDFQWVNENDLSVAPWVNSGDMIKAAINLKFPSVPAPKPEFNYCTPNTQILSGVLTKLIGGSLRAFAQEHLFTPLGIPARNWSWGMDDQGNYLGGYGMYFRPRDVARFGYLFANGGWWNGRQIISPGWVHESTTPKVRTRQWMDYGYLWWIHENPELTVFEARGSGGHLLTIVPSLDLVVVVMGVGGGDLPDPDFVIHEYILKAVTDQ